MRTWRRRLRLRHVQRLEQIHSKQHLLKALLNNLLIPLLNLHLLQPSLFQWLGRLSIPPPLPILSSDGLPTLLIILKVSHSNRPRRMLLAR